jgi:hypothetical protein
MYDRLVKNRGMAKQLSVDCEKFGIQVSVDSKEWCVFEVSLTLAYLRVRPYIWYAEQQVAQTPKMRYDAVDRIAMPLWVLFTTP